MRLPDDVVREVFPWEEFTLARSLVDNGVPEGESEDDLFAGLRAPARTDRSHGGRMTKYLTQEWLDEARELAGTSPSDPARRRGCSDVVDRWPDGDIAYWWRLEDGKLLGVGARQAARRSTSR